MKIPRILHFIWVGDLHPTMPYANLISVLKWTKNNPSCDINVWVDERSQQSREQCEANYWTQIAACNSTGGEMIFSETELAELRQRLHIKYIEDEPEIHNNPFINYELYRLRPNFGAASDLIRYKLLYKYGGIYIDSDALTGEEALETLQVESHSVFDSDLPYHRLYVDPNCIGSGYVSNDAFISTPDNPLMLEVSQMAEHNYDPERNKNDVVMVMSEKELPGFPTSDRYYRGLFAETDLAILLKQATSYENIEFVQSLTLARTGPKCLRSVLRPVAETQADSESKAEIDMHGVLRHLPKQYRYVPEDMKQRELGSWINLYVRRYDINQPDEKNAAIEQALQSIRFEANHMKILRLDDHVSYLCNAFIITDKKSKEQIAAELIERLRDIDLSQIEATQLTFHFDTTLQFHNQHPALLSKTFLFPTIDFNQDVATLENLIELREMAIANNFHPTHLPAFCVDISKLDSIIDMTPAEKTIVSRELLVSCKGLKTFVDSVNQRIKNQIDTYTQLDNEKYRLLDTYFETINTLIIQNLEYCNQLSPPSVEKQSLLSQLSRLFKTPPPPSSLQQNISDAVKTLKNAEKSVKNLSSALAAERSKPAQKHMGIQCLLGLLSFIGINLIGKGE